MSGFAFGVSDEIGQRLERRRGVDDQDQRKRSKLGHRLEIPHRVVTQLLIDGRIDDHRAAGTDQQRVTIGCGACDVFGGKDRTRAGLVFNDDRLAETFRQLLPDDAGDDVVAASWREADHDANRPAGIFVLVGRMCRTEIAQTDGGQRQAAKGFHHFDPSRGNMHSCATWSRLNKFGWPARAA